MNKKNRFIARTAYKDHDLLHDICNLYTIYSSIIHFCTGCFLTILYHLSRHSTEMRSKLFFVLIKIDQFCCEILLVSNFLVYSKIKVIGEKN